MSLDKVRTRAETAAMAASPDPLLEYDLHILDTASVMLPAVAAPTNAEWWDEEFDWGGDGAFDECVGIAEGNVDDPEAFCAQRHYDAVGKWPTEKGTVAAVAMPDGKLASAFIPHRS